MSFIPTTLSHTADTPRSVSLEQAVLCTLLHSPNQVLDIVSDRLIDEAFTEPEHRQLFQLVRSIFDKIPYSDVPLAESPLFVEALAASEGCLALVQQLMMSRADMSALRRHALQLQQLHLLRQIVVVAHRLQQAALTDDATEIQEALERGVGALNLIAAELGQDDKCSYTMSQVVDTITEDLQEMTDHYPKPRYWVTGVRQIDDIKGVVVNGLVSIESDTPFLDTQLALLMAAHNATAGGLPVLIVSSRLSAFGIGQLMISMRAGVTKLHLQNGLLDDKEWFQFVKHSKQLGDASMSLVEMKEEMTSGQLLQVMRRKEREYGKLGMIVIDDVLSVPELMRCSVQAHDPGRSVVQFFRRLASEFQCPLVTVASAEMANIFRTESDLHMRLEGMRKGQPPVFPGKAKVHISRSGYGHLGAAEIDFGAAHDASA